jgi:cysteine desulfurase
VPDISIPGEGADTVPHILTVCVPGVDSESLLMHLDLAGIAAGSGSACATGTVEPSHVLAAMGMPRELAIGAVRFSLGRETTDADVARAAVVFPEVVAKVRSLATVLGR